MQQTCAEKLKILEDELISPQELDKMNDIIRLVDELYDSNIKYDEVLPAINNLPKYTIIDKENVASKYEESIYKLALYANFINRFELFQNQDVYRIVDEFLRKEVEQFPVYNSDAPKGLKDAITNTRCNSSRNGYVEYNLMLQLFAYKYGKSFPDFTSELGDSIEIRDDKISYLKKLKKQIKKFGAKAAFWTIFSIATYATPAAVFTHIGNRISTKKEYATEVISDDGVSRRGEYWDLPFSASFPDDYRRQKLQYITEFGETIDGKVVIKVYDYTGIDISKETINNIDLDINRLVYCNVEAVDSYTNSNTKWYRTYLGEYTGEAHRNITTVENHLYVTKDKGEFWGTVIFFSVIAYGILIGINCALSQDGTKILFAKVASLLDERKTCIENKERAEEEIENLKKRIDEYAEITFINYKANSLDSYNEKYGNSEEEFQKGLRR